LGCSRTMSINFEQAGAINTTGQGGQSSSRPLDVAIVCVLPDQREKWGSPQNPVLKPTEFFGRKELPVAAGVKSKALPADFNKHSEAIELPKKFRGSNESSFFIYARYQGPDNQSIDTRIISLDHLIWKETITVRVGPSQLELGPTK